MDRYKEKSIETLKEIIDEGWLISDMEKCTAIDACEFGISAIEKLDKIEQIIADWKADTWTDNKSYECMCQIAEVIKCLN